MKKGDKKIEQIYAYLCKYTAENGYPPTVREVAAECGIKSTSGVHYYFEKMKRSGLIGQQQNKKRAVHVEGRSATNFVPVIGNVSAGKGILAQENREGEFPLPQNLFAGEDLYALRVEGDSMCEAGIDDGDYVIVRRQSSVDIGEIAVVLWEDKATVKRVVQTAPYLVLHPENSAMEDIVITAREFPEILGKVIGCVKKF